ncbi:MAG: hypothetical protein E7258_07690 [Lachnospiraceae bacterium]|nr:hypothetical protein [Lachnospiraceae bacterium]
MKRYLSIFMIAGILVLSTGCQSKENSTETVQLESDETEYIDESMWEFNENVDTDKASWEAYLPHIVDDISGLDWVASVSISPETYDEYVTSGKVTIICTVSLKEDITPENEKSIADYIDAYNLFEDYEIVFN